MGQAIPRQHPAVVLRSHFNQLRALLAVAMIAVAGLTVAVVILANDDQEVSSTSTATPAESAPAGSTRYDGGPEEGTRGVAPARVPNAGAASPSARYDGGPNEGTADVTPAELPRVTQQQAFPGLAREANGASADASPSQAGTKDYSKNGATGEVAPPDAKQSGRPDGGPEEGSHLR
jgi:hypothetical protein